ncbi:MAG: hypothetical protein IPJ48_14060 [Propionivibrio sp.]|uniref:Uncharacterized protein n=1 Tax=Candidatus Propionivibrio dominans TaxID=2954373 RepID=A0A9D7FDW8_9RHOO|nr:hypothetical protein [Candidatus Propionivibrio dominans]
MSGLFLRGGIAILSAVVAGCFYVPGAQDHEQAGAVAKFITERYGRFDKRSDVERTHSGKIYYVAPGRYPLVQFYEITDPQDIRSIEESAKEALAATGVEKVKLVFFEKQNLSCAPGGGCSRRSEHVVKEVLVTR